MFEFTQIGWFNPASKRFCYTDEKEVWPDRRSSYTHPVFAIDSETAKHLMVQLEPEKEKIKTPTLKEALKGTGTPPHPIYDFHQRASIQSKEEMYEYMTAPFHRPWYNRIFTERIKRNQKKIKI